jgi:NAD(P)-dependent dehydrogenase (short-subunit alcohol dehydrogenase family)
MPKTILITGASSGIGLATVNQFAKADWNVIATMRSPEADAELAAMGDRVRGARHFGRARDIEPIFVSRCLTPCVDPTGSETAVVVAPFPLPSRGTGTAARLD